MLIKRVEEIIKSDDFADSKKQESYVCDAANDFISDK